MFGAALQARQTHGFPKNVRSHRRHHMLASVQFALRRRYRSPKSELQARISPGAHAQGGSHLWVTRRAMYGMTSRVPERAPPPLHCTVDTLTIPNGLRNVATRRCALAALGAVYAMAMCPRACGARPAGTSAPLRTHEAAPVAQRIFARSHLWSENPPRSARPRSPSRRSDTSGGVWGCGKLCWLDIDAVVGRKIVMPCVQ